jgi:hypothetical protein
MSKIDMLVPVHSTTMSNSVEILRLPTSFLNILNQRIVQILKNPDSNLVTRLLEGFSGMLCGVLILSFGKYSGHLEVYHNLQMVFLLLPMRFS